VSLVPLAELQSVAGDTAVESGLQRRWFMISFVCLLCQSYNVITHRAAHSKYFTIYIFKFTVIKYYWCFTIQYCRYAISCNFE
jgi:hypothetical protein